MNHMYVRSTMYTCQPYPQPLKPYTTALSLCGWLEGRGNKIREGYHNTLLGQFHVHFGSGGGQPWTHDVGPTEDELDGSFVYLHMGEEEGVCKGQSTETGEAATSRGEGVRRCSERENTYICIVRIPYSRNF